MPSSILIFPFPKFIDQFRFMALLSEAIEIMRDRRGHQGRASEPFDVLIVSSDGEKLPPLGSYLRTKRTERKR